MNEGYQKARYEEYVAMNAERACLNRKAIVVTGAGSGIGHEIALKAALEGYAIVAVSRHKEQLDGLASRILEDGGICVTLAADVTDGDTPQRIVQTARECFGRLDVLINNAGAATGGRLLEQSDEDIDAQWHLHVAAPLRITRAALPLLREANGQVMFVGSGLARVPSPYYGAYCAAKAAVRAMTTQLRRELRDTGIAVTYIDPGSVRTNFSKNAGIESFGPDWVTVEASHVAERVVRAIRTRPTILNAVPLHTLAAMLGEWFPGMTDRAMAQRPPPPAVHAPAPAPYSEPRAAAGAARFRFGFRARARTGLAPDGTREIAAGIFSGLLRPGEDVQLTDAAMRWAGMPNKNERAAMSEALEALAAGGFLEKTGEERWRVLRSAN